MRTFALAALAAVSSAINMAEFEFMNYVTKFQKNYDDVAEFETRMALFNATNAKIEALNAQNSGSYKAGHNHMSDWTDEEYRSMLGLVLPEDHMDDETPFEGTPNSSGIDWRTDSRNALTAVKDQGQCGSCWAFSATETVESAFILAGNDAVVMSPQELVDCSKGLLSNHGCNGGMYYNAWKWEKSHYAMKESDYPYVSGTTKKANPECSYDESKGVAEVKSYTQVKANVDSIKAAVEQQPLSIAVMADNDAFRNYTSGVITADQCPGRIDHAIQAVGWGNDGTQDYFIVRNSWNTVWGDAGFAKLAADDSGDGTCGMNSVVYYVNM